MKEVPSVILDAWRRVELRLADDQPDLDRRLRRRRAETRPPRAWCLAIRASDTRLPAPPNSWRAWFARDPAERVDEVTLDRYDVRRLCAPVSLDAPGMTLEQAAARLGVKPLGLLPARVDGLFHQHYVPGLGGRWGRPRPLIFAYQPLDPSSKGLLADPVWPWTASSLLAQLPAKFPPQKLQRVPRWQKLGPSYRDTSDLHPEHPDRAPPGRRDRKSRVLPKPPPDYVWYKWKGDQYVGYDWRNPAAAAGHLRMQRRLASMRLAKKTRRLTHPPPRKAGSSLQHRGWCWICPHCRRAVNVLFLPLPPLKLSCAFPGIAHLIERAKLPAPRVQGFACEKCHRVRRFSHCDRGAWSEVIRYLSGGMLYGREVPRPSCLVRRRKIAYKPRPSRAPSVRRPQVERRLLQGRPFRRIAAELGLAYGTILWYARGVYRQHGVRSLKELLRKHGGNPPPTKKEQVRQRLVQGQTVAQIAGEMGISAMCVYNHVYMLRRAGLITATAKARQRAYISTDQPLQAPFSRSNSQFEALARRGPRRAS